MNAGIREEIENTEKQLEGSMQRFEELKGAFIAAAVQFIEPLWDEKALELIRQEPDIAKATTKESMIGLKKSVAALRERTNEIVAEELNEGSVWWHEARGSYRHGPPYDRSEIIASPPANQDLALRRALGNLARPFEELGFIKTTRGSHNPKAWRGPYVVGKNRPHSGDDRPIYPSDWRWSNEMAEVMLEYGRLESSFRSAKEKLKELKKSRNEAEAEDLWKDA